MPNITAQEMNIPFYVMRKVDGEYIPLKVNGWNYKEWPGCFCYIKDRPNV